MYGAEEWHKRQSIVLPPEDDPRKWSLGRKCVETFRLLFWKLKFLAIFSLGSLSLGHRITHRHGVAGKGTLVISENNFGLHENFPIFEPGKVFDIYTRQADATYEDNCACVVRSCSMKLYDGRKNVMDFLMNSGKYSVIWNIPEFLRLMKLRKDGESSEVLNDFFKQNPLATEKLGDNIMRVETLANLMYTSKVRFLVTSKEKKVMACHFRCVPKEPAPKGKISYEVIDTDGTWNRGRLAGDKRATNYLYKEYEKRIARGPIEYMLQVQQKEVLPEHHSFSRDMYYFNAEWDEKECPWETIGIASIDTVLDGDAARKLRFNIANRPRWLKLPKSYSIEDYCAIGQFRNTVYPKIQPLRILSYAVKNIFGKGIHYNYDNGNPLNERDDGKKYNTFS